VAPSVRRRPDPRYAVAEAAVFEHFGRFQKSCFGAAIELGSRAKYAQAFDPKELVFEDATPTAVKMLGARSAQGALADQTGTFGEPLPNIMFLPFKLPTTGGAKPLNRDNRATVWHEATHQIEALHGVRQTEVFLKNLAYRERNTAYLDAAIRNLVELEPIDSHMQRKSVGETDEEWEAWKRDTGGPELEKIAARFREIETGIATKEALAGKFKPGDVQEWPPELQQLQAWAGVKISWSEIRSRYASGACGDSLKQWAAGSGVRELVDVKRQDTPRDDDQLRGRGWFAEPTYGDTSFSVRLGGKPAYSCPRRERPALPWCTMSRTISVSAR
jgi:hypothetical protein